MTARIYTNQEVMSFPSKLALEGDIDSDTLAPRTNRMATLTTGRLVNFNTGYSEHLRSICTPQIAGAPAMVNCCGSRQGPRPPVYRVLFLLLEDVMTGCKEHIGRS